MSDVFTNLIFCGIHFFAYMQMYTRLTSGSVDITAQRDCKGVIIMFCETLDCVMSLPSVSGEVGLWLVLEMFLAASK
jgi:hypothetical protein